MSEVQKGKKVGKNNYQWKEEGYSYVALHRWVRKYKGIPIKCESCGKEKTTPKSVQWANTDHLYKRNLKDWLALCFICHAKYDKENKLRSNFNYKIPTEIEIKGKKKSLKDWCHIFNINYLSTTVRINKGLDPVLAITLPFDKGKKLPIKEIKN